MKVGDIYDCSAGYLTITKITSDRVYYTWDDGTSKGSLSTYDWNNYWTTEKGIIKRPNFQDYLTQVEL